MKQKNKFVSLIFGKSYKKPKDILNIYTLQRIGIMLCIALISGMITGIILNYNDTADYFQNIERNQIPYNKELLQEIKPSMLEGLKGIYFVSNSSFMRTEDALGTYQYHFKKIVILYDIEDIYSNGYNLSTILCHELLHHQWSSKEINLTKYQREYKDIEPLLSKNIKEKWSDAGEYYSYTNMDDWKNCFKKNIKDKEIIAYID